jgi:hypothetical protein
MDIFNLDFIDSETLYFLDLTVYPTTTEVSVSETEMTYHIDIVEQDSTVQVNLSNQAQLFELNVNSAPAELHYTLGGEASASFQLQVSEAIFAVPITIKSREFEYTGEGLSEVRNFLQPSYQDLYQTIEIGRSSGRINTITYRDESGEIDRVRNLVYQGSVLVGETS